MLTTTVAPVPSSRAARHRARRRRPALQADGVEHPGGVGWSRGAGLPAHSNAASDLTTKAPSAARSRGRRARRRSRPCPTPSSPGCAARPSRPGPSSRSFVRRRPTARGDARRTEPDSRTGVVLLQRADLSGCSRCSASPCTAARAALDRRHAADAVECSPALRICSPSLRPALDPAGVLTTKATFAAGDQVDGRLALAAPPSARPRTPCPPPRRPASPKLAR